MTKIAEVLFFAGGEADDVKDEDRFIHWLTSGHRTMDICVFTITSNRLVSVLWLREQLTNLMLTQVTSLSDHSAFIYSRNCIVSHNLILLELQMLSSHSIERGWRWFALYRPTSYNKTFSWLFLWLGWELQIRIITDNDCMTQLGSDIQDLAASGIPVKCDTSSAHMHHKWVFCVYVSVSVLVHVWFELKFLENSDFAWLMAKFLLTAGIVLFLFLCKYFLSLYIGINPLVLTKF